MKLPQMRKIKWNYPALAFLVPFLGMTVLMLIAGYTPFGNKSMLYSDMWHQYYPFFRSFRDALRSGESLLYNWEIGMGIDYLGLLSYYLASPLNLLSVLVPGSMTLPYFAMLMPIKLGLAGLFFAIFLKKTFGKNDISLPLFGGFYAMCAWAMGYQWNVMWLDTFALLPLVVLGTLAVLKERKFILYTLTLFLSVYANYYIGFFTCIFVLLVCICYEICCCRSVGRFFGDLGCMAVFSGLAICMTAILSLPALAALQTTQSSVNSFPKYFSLNMVDSKLCQGARDAWQAYKDAREAGGAGFALWWKALGQSFLPVLNGMYQCAGNMGGGLVPTFKEGLPNLYCGVGTIVLAFLFLTAEKVRVREKICSVMLLLFFMVSFVVRQLDYVWHGFHFTNMIPYRFSFLFSFVMLYMAYRAYLLRRRFQIWQYAVAGLLTLAILFCSKDLSKPVFLVYNGVFLLIYLAVFVWWRWDSKLPEGREERKEYFADRRQRRQFASFALAGVMGVELVINLVNFGVNFPYTGISDYPRGTKDTQKVVEHMLEDDSPFYRAEVTHSQTLNDGALNGYPGISTFTSSCNVRVTEFMKKLGYAAKNTYNRYCFEESSPVSNLFLNLKYMLERSGEVEENPYFDDVYQSGKVHLLQNNAYLPLGFLAAPELQNFEFQLYGNAFQFQNHLLKAAAGIKEDVWSVLTNRNLEVIENKTKVTSKTSAGYVAYDNEKEKTVLTMRYTVDKPGFLCLDLTMSARNSYAVRLNDKHLYSESMSLPQTIAVSQVRPGDVVDVNITCKAKQKGTVSVRAGILNEEVFRKAYAILAQSPMEITSFDNTRVEGTVNCSRDGLLYTSIPQNGNWSLSVDGKEAEIHLVGGAMISVPLTQGQHTLCFTYRNAAFEMGWKVTLLSFAVFAAISLAVYLPRRKKLKKSSKK